MQMNDFHQIWEVFSHYFFRFLNASFSFLPPSWILSVLYVGTVDSVPQDSETRFIKKNFFFIWHCQVLAVACGSFAALHSHAWVL